MNQKELKKEKVLRKSKSIPLVKKLVVAAVIAAAVVTGVVITIVLASNTPNAQDDASSVADIRQTADEVVFSAQLFQDGTARYFKHDFSDGTVRFFIVRSTDDVIRAAYDACDVCFASKRGYRQTGDVMICNNCGQVFPTDRINIEMGGCNPAPLTREMRGNDVVIKISEIHKGLRFF